MIQTGDHHRRLLWALSEAGQASRTELAIAAGLSKAAVTTATRELMDFGLIAEVETVRRTGRPSTLLALREGAVWFAGLSLRPGRGRMVLCDITGRIAARRDLPGRTDPDEICAAMAGDLDALLAGSGIDRAAVYGMGISISGVVNAEQDTCIRSTLMGWSDVPLGRMASAALGLPVLVENDANALAIHEKLFGGFGARSFALVDVADGIGGALLIGRQLFRGAEGGAGEIAHITVAPGGEPCICGKRGCLDTVASLRAMAAAARGLGLDGTTPADLERAAAQGDERAVAILHGAGEALGLALAHLIQIVNPERVVLRMEAETTEGLFAMAMMQSIDANVLPQMRRRTQIDIGPKRDGAHAAGAASVAAHRLLLTPDTTERKSA
ncbi:ROK family transcriptional regulator [Palleronia sediminis]|uniref:ROK family transcriptional regulator n=1 Tax=Palleronia sediminis TaxID=2547833 RepID=A0A4R6A7R8_9RHOB|nr:ROK family transcriptional regulator [Palleronia sediminis]TDL78248.1 ROK family transcriptional regulator [Palleronia sediminis]